MNKLLLTFIVFIFTYSCKSQKDKGELRVNEKDSADRLIGYSGQNERMNNAIIEAKKSFSIFLEELRKPCDSCAMFLVKMKFEEDGSIEHMWVDSLHFKGSKLFGILSSTPESIKRVALGDLIEVRKDSLSDWMYVRNRKLIGGYTVKVIYDDMKPAEKRQMEEDFQAKIRD